MRKWVIVMLAAMLSACATTGDQAGLDPRDPYEKFNRGMWGFNQGVDKAVVKPVATAYRTVTPVPARRGISGILRNLTEPFSAINALLQGKPDRALNSLGRFVINTTIGVGGLADHATGLGLPETREDFGQTLAVAGAKTSPYLVLPVLGPSTVRDAVGTAVGVVADPAGIVISNELGSDVSRGVTVTRIVDGRSRAIDDGSDALFESSADAYATARSTFFQRRQAQIDDADPSVVGSNTPESVDDMLNEALEEDSIAPTTEPQAVEPELEPEAEPVSDPQLSYDY